MDDPVDKMCDELGVCREEALFYLEGFRWDSDAATEACRSNTLPTPSLAVQSSSEAPRTQPLMTVSNHPPGLEEEQRRNQQIVTFCEVALGATVDDARFHLSRKNWNLHAAIDEFLTNFRPTAADRKSNPLPFSNDGRTTVSQPSPHMFSGSDSMQDVLSRVPQFDNNFVRIGNSSRPTEDDTTETLEDEGPSNDVRRKCVEEFLDMASGASLRAALNSLNACKWNVDDALDFFFRENNTEATPEIASSQVHESGNPTHTTEENLSSESEESAEAPPDPQTQLFYEQLITSFQVIVETTRQVAIDYLTHCNWSVQEAVGMFVEGYPVKNSSAGMALSLPQNRNVPLPSTGLPSESQFEASYVSQSQDYLKEGGTGSSSSRIDAVPRSVLNAGEGDVTVAIPGMASYQVDAVEEESSVDPFANQDRTTVVTENAPDTITINVVLADDGSGTSLDLPFRPNQTVRDIRNAIDERAPDNDRGYLLQSMTGVDYTDLNITVYRIAAGGSTTLFQIFPGP